MTQGRTIRLFLIDGKPNGLLTAEIINWTGHVLSGSRSKLSDLINRPECRRTGVYFLFGSNPADIFNPFAYIGESDDIAARLKQHNRPEDSGGKDFWDQVCVITSKDNNLTKSHIKYLESSLISLAKKAKKYDLKNTAYPVTGNMPESDIADMEYFIEQIKTILPLLGFNILIDSKIDLSKSEKKIDSHKNPIFTMTMPKYGITSSAKEIDGEFIVLKNSLARSKWVGKGHHNSYKHLHMKLCEDGVLIDEGNGLLTFNEDYAFSSPSAAAAVIAGRPANGRTKWRVENERQTYDEWQNNLLEKIKID